MVIMAGGYLLWRNTMTAEEQVSERAIARWQALIKGDFKKAYDYLGPGYRSATPYAVYEAKVKSSAVEWGTIGFTAARCEPGVCVVELTLSYHPKLKDFDTYHLQQKLSERWVNTDNQWWYVP